MVDRVILLIEILSMTAQIPEKLHFDGEPHSLCAEPLNSYFELAGVVPPFDAFYSTALWRGYVGTWEIISGRLYLVELQGWMVGREHPCGLAELFPDFPYCVFAHWYSGELRVPQGRLLNYVHGGYASTYERDLFLTLQAGVVTGQRVQVNGVADPDAPASYTVAAATFHR